MISDIQRRHIFKLASIRRGKTTSDEVKLKRKETFKLKEKQRLQKAGNRFCLNCGKQLTLTIYSGGKKEAITKYLKRIYCSLYCARHSDEFKKRFATQNKGQKHPSWKGGRNTTGKGYIEIWTPEHPHSNHYGYVREHRLVMETKLGRYLKPKEVVHHIDENTSNNNIHNLMLFQNSGYHISHHLKLKNL